MAKIMTIPNDIISDIHEHPEEYGHLIVKLENNMFTDVYYDYTKKAYYTITGEKELIKYLKKRKRRNR